MKPHAFKIRTNRWGNSYVYHRGRRIRALQIGEGLSWAARARDKGHVVNLSEYIHANHA